MSEAIAVAYPQPLTTVDFLTVGLSPLKQAVLAWLIRFREPTQTCYRRDISIYLDWCERVELEPLEAKRVHLELYIKYLQTRGWSKATVNSRFCTVSSFYTNCLRDEVIIKDPCQFVVRPKIVKEEQHRPGMSPLTLGVFLDAAEEIGVMHHALLALLGLRGLRISEACSLDVPSVHWHKGYLHVRGMGKGDKGFDMPLCMPSARAVSAAIDDRTEGPLLLTKWRTRMTRNAAQRIIDEIAEHAHLDVDVTPHSFRRGFIMTMLANGEDLRDVQKAARHENPDTTARYDVRKDHPDRDASHSLGSFIAGMKG